MEHLEPILERPDDMVAMMKCRVATGGIAHSESKAEASIRLKSDGFLFKRDSKEQIDAYAELKWAEVSRWETTPSPVEFDMYYSA